MNTRLVGIRCPMDDLGVLSIANLDKAELLAISFQGMIVKCVILAESKDAIAFASSRALPVGVQ